jgi:hypothetical protein
MQKEGISYGQKYSAEFFEESLRAPRDAIEFKLGVHQVRRELEKSGYYLSGRGGAGNSFVILPPSQNAEVMSQYGRLAADALKRGVILGTSTRLDTLSDGERRRHESMLERMAIKSVLIHRSSQVAHILSKSAPRLIQRGSSKPPAKP